jgi:hypothetical protein
MSAPRRTPLLRIGFPTLAATLAVSLLFVVPANADPPRPDVTVTVATDPAEIVSIGGWTAVTAEVRNVGAGPSHDITLDLTLPAGWHRGDGFSIPSDWQCDYGTWICTHEPLEAGEAATPVSIRYGIPAGTIGDVMTVRADVTAGPESSTANNTVQTTLRYIQGHVDLELTTTSPEQEVITGELASISPRVRNTGNLPSEPVTVTVPLPAGMTHYSESGTGWDCAFGDTLADGGPGWRCTHGPLQPGQLSGETTIVATVTDANPGDVLTMTATASTSSPETTVDNNTTRATITVLEPATVRGTVWLDADRDGVRDTEESGISGQYIDQIVAVSQVSGMPGALATVNPDGTYLIRMRPGSYRVEFLINSLYLFTTSADSDLVYYDNYVSQYVRYGHSGSFTLAGGEQTVVDAAVVSYYN